MGKADRGNPTHESSGEDPMGAQTSPSAAALWGFSSDGKPRKRPSRVLFSDLPRALENLTADSFKMLRDVIRFDVNKVSDARLRSMVTAGLGVIGTR
jgi:hypothetical protein